MRTHFGFEAIDADEKPARVRAVFDSVAGRYDLMNDLMSAGLHRLWKRFMVQRARLRPGQQVLDVASGTGDLARAYAQQVGPAGRVWMTDINAAMLAQGRDRLLDRGLMLPLVVADAQALPFPEHHFDCVSVAFGLRNMTSPALALAEMRRVLKPGGRLLVLEFSRVARPLTPLYDWYSFKVLPWLGDKVTGDGDSYRYLAESIRMHPDQPALAELMRAAGLARVDWFNLSAGVVALHEGVKL